MQWGWNAKWEDVFDPWRKEGLEPARVVLEHKHTYTVVTSSGELLAEITGRMRHLASGRADYPAVGDWVAVAARSNEGRAAIHGIVPRISKFSRKTAGAVTEEQIVATNMNTVFLVMALHHDYNVRRMERYLTAAWESGANPVILLSKADLSERIEEAVREMEQIAFGVPVHVVSTLEGKGLDSLAPYVGPGQTVAFLGSSGVGKSTLINRLLGREAMETGVIRQSDGRGKHTTTHRELLPLPGGGLLIDTPGMRELQLWGADEGFGTSFADIEELSGQCRFPDCRHDREPGCAIQAALADGTLESGRYNSYIKLQKELAYFERKESKALQAAEKLKWKKIHQAVRNRPHR
ncbi:ribosome small subunit-dependent GTPase A [Paenibacillus chartarius]|uniref:Small ribosomal subunit biogenesis GTPase RsgA n=1 Tax=Paenibacillus chartarius TaxID=747481 RepID=A0ABV6DVF8_9BACL